MLAVVRSMMPDRIRDSAPRLSPVCTPICRSSIPDLADGVEQRPPQRVPDRPMKAGVVMNILDILTPESIKVPLEAGDKKSAIDELVDVLGDAGRICNTEGLKEAVWEREQQRTTGIGEGLAIPHGKSDCSTELTMAIGRPAQPIDFNSVDKKPVKLIILLASPANKTADHIQALGKISRLMADPAFREKVYAAESNQELYEMLAAAEKQKA